MALCTTTISSSALPGKPFATPVNTAFTSRHPKINVVCPIVVQLSTLFRKWLIMNDYKQFARESYTLWRMTKAKTVAHIISYSGTMTTKQRETAYLLNLFDIRYANQLK